MPKIQKMVIDASLLNTQHYTIWIKGKWIKPRKGVVASPTPQSVVAIEKRTFGLLLTKISQLSIYIYVYIYVYIFTNLLSTSIHCYQEKRKKNARNKR